MANGKYIPVVAPVIDRKTGKITDWKVSQEPVWAGSAILDNPDEFGELIKINLRGLPKEERRSVLLRLGKHGKEFNGNTYFVTHALSATKSGVVPAMTLRKGEEWFPVAKDAIRLNALSMPGYLFSGNVVAHIRFVDEGQEGTDDGQIPVHPRFIAYLNSMLGDKVEQVGDAFGPLRGTFLGAECYFKGASYDGVMVNGECTADIVVPKSVVKGIGMHNVMAEEGATDLICEFHLSIMENAKRQIIDTSYQDGQHRSQEVNQELDRMMPLIVHAAQLNGSDPLTWVKAHGEPEMRDEDGRVLDTGLLHRVALFCMAANNNDLMRSARINKIIADKWAQENIDIVIDGGARGVGLMAFRKADIPIGIALVNPKDARDGDYILKRYPHPEDKAAVGVRVVAANWVPRGTIWTHKTTTLRTKNDCDSDKLVIVSCEHPHIRRWWHELKAVPYEIESGKRDEAEKDNTPPPQDRAEMIERIMTVSIGTVANAIRDVQALWWKKPSLRPKCEQFMKVLSRELLKAVDAAKHASMPNMDEVKRIIDWCAANGLSEVDTGFARIGNGSLPSWRFAQDDIIAPLQIRKEGDTRPLLRDIKKGEYVLPWEHVSDATPIGRRIIKWGPELPQFALTGYANGEFVNYLPVIEGEGADYAKKTYDAYQADLSATGFIEDEETQAKARAVIVNRWQEHCNELRLTKPHDWQVSFVSKLWNIQFSKSSKQYFLWNSIPEVIFELLMQRAESGMLTAVQPTVTGHIIGKTFERFFQDGQAVAHLDVEFMRRENGQQAVRVVGDKEDFGLSSETGKITVDGGTIEVKRKSAGRFSFTLYGLTREQAASLESEARPL